MENLKNIFHLGVKEFQSLLRDPAMVGLIVFAFSVNIYLVAKSQPETLQSAPIAITDEDQTPLSMRIQDSLYAPYFQKPILTSQEAANTGMNSGIYSYSLDIPPNFQRDVIAGRSPSVQLNIDATQISQSYVGSGYLETILGGQVGDFVHGYRSVAPLPIEVAQRTMFNPNLIHAWYSALTELINNIAMLSIILTGAALVREREHGTIEHLLVMPLTAFQIMMSKIWSMGTVVMVAVVFALQVIIRGQLGVVTSGSVLLFSTGVLLTLLSTTSMGIFLGTISRSMPQFGLLVILTLLPLEILSGSLTPASSMPFILQKLMLIAPTTHLVNLAQAILFRGAGIAVIWPEFVWVIAIAVVFFVAALHRFRSSIGTMQS